MLGVVTARSTAKWTCCSMHMNIILLLTAQSCSRGYYARTDVAVKCWR